MQPFDLTRTADRGLAFVCREAATPRNGGYGPIVRRPQIVTVGFTAPTVTYARMRQMQSSAEALDRDIKQYVSDPLFQNGWDGWYHESWLPFYQKYAGPDAGWADRVAASFESDEIARIADSYRQQLEGWYADYARQKTRAGQPVPSAAGRAPTLGELHRTADTTSSSLGIPWWVWGIGGIAAAGLGYYAYRRVTGLLGR